MDERIREKARKALAVEIGAALKPLYDKMRGADQSHTLVVTSHDGTKNVKVCMNVWAQLRETQENLVALLAPAAGEAAVAEFIAKVESLQEQIDSLSIQQ
jgi:hypothetical protein